MKAIGVQRLLQGVLLVIFLVSLIGGGTGFYLLLRGQAVRDAEQQARLLLAAAMGARGYTDAHILPQFSHLPANAFHEETVPSFAAQAILNNLSVGGASYTYREPAINPTSLSDRANPFELEMLQRFSANPHLTEITGTTDTAGQTQFFLAKPIRITDAMCLSCHDTPARAPVAMIAKYGTVNGFRWRLGQTVAMQISTVPVAQQFQNTLTFVAFLAIGLMLIFGASYMALSSSLAMMVTQPLRQLAQAADAASRAPASKSPLPHHGVEEVQLLSAALERLRISLAKALRALGDP